MQRRDPDQALLAAGHALGISLEQHQVRRLLGYLALLEKWNRIHNLTSVREPGRMLEQHVFDCMAVVEPLRREVGSGPFRLLDVGSGAGLPGAVIAALMPQVAVVCVDAVAKKTAFIRQASAELALTNLVARHARVEQLNEGGFEVATSRAFASLAVFVEQTRRHLGPVGRWMAMKGRVPKEELAALPIDVTFHVEPLHVPGLEAERCLVWMARSP